MVLDTDFVTSANATPSSGVLLSERTQLILLSAIDLIQSRYQWVDMSDSEWDTIDAAISKAIVEILTLSGSGDVTKILLSAARTATQSFSSGDNSIIFNDGDYDSGNPTRLVIPDSGDYIITANFLEAHYGATPNARMTVRLNGSDLIASDWGDSQSRQAMSASRVMTLSQDDYLEMIINAESSDVTIDTSQPPNLSVLGFY